MSEDLSTHFSQLGLNNNFPQYFLATSIHTYKDLSYIEVCLRTETEYIVTNNYVGCHTMSTKYPTKGSIVFFKGIINPSAQYYWDEHLTKICSTYKSPGETSVKVNRSIECYDFNRHPKSRDLKFEIH